MIYVIKTALNDVIVLDSIMSFSESYQGGVTSHPVEDGTKISDHSVTEKVKIKISGVVSDYNFFNPLKDYNNDPYQKDIYGNAEYLNRYGSDGVNIGLSVPDSMTTFAGEADTIYSVMTAQAVIKSKLIEVQRNRTFVDIIGYSSTGEVSRFSPCILTDISFQETPDNGYAIYPEMQFEQINTVKVVITQADAARIVPQEIKIMAADQANKGNVPGSTGSTPEALPKDKHQLQMDEYDRIVKVNACKALWVDRAIDDPPECAYELNLVRGVKGLPKYLVRKPQ